ncbi:MAG: porin [Rhodocyclaceae bacterium]|nr:porin [Rhodocyclaceae bacterium]
MQKKLIALAVAGLASTAAFAQSNVTIYGVVDAGYLASSGDRGNAGGDANRNGINSGLLSGSRIGFRGEEGLGNGLKAVFTLEYGLDVDGNFGVGTSGTGSSGLTARQQFIGLSSATVGTVALGRQYAPAFYASGRNDPFMSSTGIGSLARLTSGAGNTISGTGVVSDNGGSRWDNAVTYTSPTWSGFSVRAAYSFGERNGGANGVSSGDNGKFGLGANYANGGLNLDVVFQHTKEAQLAAVAGNDNVTEWYVGGSYDFKVVKLFASYQDKDDKSETAANGDWSNKIWQVGATVPVFGNGKIHVGYTKLSWDQSSFDDTKAWNLMYSHALSKRTTLYTGYTRFDNGDRPAGIPATGHVRSGHNAFSNHGIGVAGEKNGTFAAGINHAF